MAKIKEVSVIKPGRGGKRSGAGRKPGARSRIAKSKERAQALGDVIVARVVGEKLDPVEAIMETVEWAIKYWRANVEAEQYEKAKEWAILVNDWGKNAAPYIRPRLNAIEAKVSVNVTVYERIERANQRYIAA